MTQSKNFFSRAIEAIMEGRAREAQRYVERFEREHPRAKDVFTKR
ncbi:hypothetical protein [Devosia limi]|uniref:Uncharacterized protein n=1 Tax=Devosia limi DSM 17137 TaxID=1121477 RepID=A0A1M4YIT1_9HYPH|nr:hypothetical protein [Devosia limi]SHF05754.1 hypothetical protein SAMN02745223_01700 [Devosia limi DSM 17137]